ncbi:hypothetical protein [Streptomyces roseolus]|uniref:hypothetical protein n=1 Tax=Streptomyces roseolus TaxID=67358 RepID=UPI001674C9BA|nr:hypothetical protein [Streptomyces roseolus]GGR67486.1 hypothetical protein GCM10010282_70460 [Streptomyces roseolus]
MTVSPSPAYRMSTRHYDGDTTARELTAGEADAFVPVALLDGAEVLPDPGRSGTLTVKRSVSGPACATGSVLVTATMTAVLVPVHAPARLTARQYQDLCIIRDQRGGTAVWDRGRVCAGVHAIPAGAASRLLARGWLTVDDVPGGPAPVCVSLAGLIAMTHREHCVTTLSGSGEYVDHRGFDRLGGWVTRAWCSCGQWSTHIAGDKAPARLAARRHRAEHLTRALALL